MPYFLMEKHARLMAAAFLLSTALVLGLSPVHGQDDNSVPPPPESVPPPQESDAPAADDTNAAPNDSASFQTFYDSLGRQGTWIQSSDYGYVWQPQVSDPDWAPYSAGHWVYTDDGWTWVSDESFGWATYHYGRWVNIDGTGWCWVPGYTWAPAWVSWRYGGGYCGWAPLPPDSFVGIDYSDDGFAIGIGFHIGGDCDAFYGIGAGCYNFIPVSCLGYPRYRGYYCHRGDNYAIINHTTNVTNINVARTGAGAMGAPAFGRVSTGGPSFAQVNAISATPIQRVNLVHANQASGSGKLTANSLAVYAPRVNSGTARPSRVASTIGETRINRGTDISRPLAVNSTLTGSPATEAQLEQARLAQNQAPASAKVMTNSTFVRPVLQSPLTQLQPMAPQASSPSSFHFPPSYGFPNERPAGTAGVAPISRTYPQLDREESTPSHVYYPNTVAPSSVVNPSPSRSLPASGESAPHTSYASPPIHAYSSPTASGPRSYPTAGGSYSNSGGAGHASSAVSSGHSGGNSQGH